MARRVRQYPHQARNTQQKRCWKIFARRRAIPPSGNIMHNLSRAAQPSRPDTVIMAGMLHASEATSDLQRLPTVLRDVAAEPSLPPSIPGAESLRQTVGSSRHNIIWTVGRDGFMWLYNFNRHRPSKCPRSMFSIHDAHL